MNTYLREVKVKTGPATEPITKANTKAWMGLKTAFTDDDTLIEDTMIPAARRQVEKFLNRSLITQTLQAYFSSYGTKVSLPYAPVISVESVKRIYLNDETLLTLNSDYYVQGLDDVYLIMASPLTVLKAGHSPSDKFHRSELVVEYIAGYGNASTVPPGIKEAIYMIVAESYKNRTNTTSEKISTIPYNAKKKLLIYKSYPM